MEDASSAAPGNFCDSSVWLKSLKKHLDTHVMPVAASHGIDITSETLHESVVAALRQPKLPVEKEMISVGKLLLLQNSFQVCHMVQSSSDPAPERETIRDEMAELPVVLVGVMAAGSSDGDRGPRLKDTSGEIPCEFLLPVEAMNCIVLLKDWNVICSTLNGSYLEVQALVNLTSRRCDLSNLASSGNVLSVADVQKHLKCRRSRGLKFSMVGRLTAICEPFSNGPENFIVIMRVASISDDSQFYHIIVKSPALLHLPRTLKLFEVYIFTELKAVTMNKGKADEQLVLTVSSHSTVNYVPSEQVSVLFSSSSSTGQSDTESTSPLRKRIKRGEEGEGQSSSDTSAATDSSVTHAPVPSASVKQELLPLPGGTSLISYKGTVTKCLLPEAGVYELDGRIVLYLTHLCLSNLSRGLRSGSEVEVHHAHVLKIVAPQWKHLSGFYCCSVGRVEIVSFSKKQSRFKGYIYQNKLAHMLRKFRAMDVAWLVSVFLSLMKKLNTKIRVCFAVFSELCRSVDTTCIEQHIHSEFLRVPHSCQLLEPVDLSLRPQVPTLEEVLSFAREKTDSPLFHWEGCKKGAFSGSDTAVLSVAVSAAWSFGIIKSSDFPNPQLLVGVLSSNSSSGNLELSDNTASLPLIPCVPYGSGRYSSKSQLMELRPGLTVALTDFTVFAEKTVEVQGHQNSSVSFYLSCRNVSVLCEEQSQRGREGKEVASEKQSQRGRKKASSDSPSGASTDKGAAVCDSPSEEQLYLLITGKNALKPKGTVSSFTAQARVHNKVEILQEKATPPIPAANVSESAVTVAMDFDSAHWYPYLHNGYIYNLSCTTVEGRKPPSLKSLRKEPSITVSGGMFLRMIGPTPSSGVSYLQPLLEVGDIVSKLYLPKLKTAFSQPGEGSRINEGLVSFRGLVVEHSYRIDYDALVATRQASWEHSSARHATTAAHPNAAMRHIIALCIRGLHCPNTVMVYCKFKLNEPLPLGLLPGAVAAFHSFTLKSSRSGNIYCTNCPCSSISIETMQGVSMDSSLMHRDQAAPTVEMANLLVSNLYDLIQSLLQGRLSRRVVCIKATMMSVQQASVQFQCQGCQCTVVDGNCMATCLVKKSVLRAEARLLIQDGSGEAHLYVQDRVFPAALGLTDREWSDLLDLVHKVGQVTYSKSNSTIHKLQDERRGRKFTVLEKAQCSFLEVITRPSFTQTRMVYCQPFLSAQEQKEGVLGQKTHRVRAAPGVEYVTLSLPRLQLRALATGPVDTVSYSTRLLALLEPSDSV